MHRKKTILHGKVFKFCFAQCPGLMQYLHKKETVVTISFANALFLWKPDVDGRVVGVVIFGIQIILHQRAAHLRTAEMHADFVPAGI